MDVIDKLNKKSLKNQVKEYIFNQIRQGNIKPGDKLITQRKLSQILNVSKKTAELAMSELEFEKVIYRRVGQGSFLLDKDVSSIRSREKTGSILLYVPNLTNPVFSSFTEKLEKKLVSLGKNIILSISSSASSDLKRQIKNIEQNGIDAVIGISIPELICHFAVNNKIPLVNIGTGGKKEFNQIIIKQEEAGRLVASYIYNEGHKNVICAGCPKFRTSSDMDIRFRVISDFLGEKGIKASIIPQEKNTTSETDYEKVGWEIVEEVLSGKEKPSLIVFYNDARALGGMKALIENGISIPDDISIIGFDNIFMSALSVPGLTTIDMGYQSAVELIFKIIDGKQLKTTKQYLLEPELIERNSVKKLI